MTFPTIKVCGMKNSDLINQCIEGGAKLIGFIVNYPKSPRSITFEQLNVLTQKIKTGIHSVAVMVNPTIEEVKIISKNCTYVQLHGDEDNNFIKIVRNETNLKIIKAIKVGEESDLEKINDYPDADYILYDTPAMGKDGPAFNFELLKNIKHKDFFVAGKIDIDNAKEALQFSNKIDVNSGLETEKGIKDPNKIKDFFNLIRKYEN